MASRQNKRSTRSRAARKGWETRREREREREAKKLAAARKRAETLRRKQEAHEARRAAARKGARRRKVRERAAAALDQLQRAVGSKARAREIDAVRESWRRAKRDVYEESDSYEDYLDILERVSEDSGTEWDIAYGPDGEAAA